VLDVLEKPRIANRVSLASRMGVFHEMQRHTDPVRIANAFDPLVNIDYEC